MEAPKHQPVAGRGDFGLVLSMVASLTVLGLALRIGGMGQSLFGDELSTYAIASQAGSPADVVRLLHDNGIVELSPPLYFLLSSGASQIGDPTISVRLVSLLAGVAMIPLTYLLGRRTIGRTGALFATALTAVCPFLIYYSVEARAYGFAATLGLLSTLALLRATDGGGARWWVAYAVASCAAVYSHYTVVFVLGAQALWALWAHRERWRPLLAANAAAAIGFLPWLPTYLDDSKSPYNITGLLHPFGFETFFRDLGDWTMSTPPVAGVGDVPGTLGAVLVGLGLLGAIAGAVAARYRTGSAGRKRPSNELVLVIALALATPVGMAVYSALGPDIYLARVLIPSSPGLMVALGALLAASRMPVRAVVLGAVLAGFVIGAVRMFDAGNERPDYRAAADFVESNTRPSEPIYDLIIGGDPNSPLGTGLAINLDDRTVIHPPDLNAAVAGQHAPRIAVVAPIFAGAAAQPAATIDGYRLTDTERFPGAIDLTASIYARAP